MAKVKNTPDGSPMTTSGMTKSRPHICLLTFAFCLLTCRPGQAATITNPVVINPTINFETLSPNGATIQFDLDAPASVHLVATDQINTNETNTFDANFAAAGTVQMFWPAYWLIGDEGGRKDRPYAITLTPTGGSTVSVSPLIHINSVDIHNLTVT